MACWSERKLTLYFSTKLLCSDTLLATGKRKIVSYWVASPSIMEKACHWLPLGCPGFRHFGSNSHPLAHWLDPQWIVSVLAFRLVECSKKLIRYWLQGWQRPLLTAATPPCQALLRCIILIGCRRSHLIGQIHMLLFLYGKKSMEAIPAHCFQEQFYACMTESMSV